MADDTRDSSSPTASSSALPGPAAAPEATQQGPPKGIILGKDGKPCRTCNTLADMTSFIRRGGRAAPAAAAAAAPPAAAAAPRPADCPPDVEQLGRASWTLLHSIAGTYPEQPSAAEQATLTSFMRGFAQLYPCWKCGEHFQSYMQRHNIRASSRDEFGNWLCEAHNAVNVTLGKKVFDCRTWEERWRTGWKNGSCD